MSLCLYNLILEKKSQLLDEQPNQKVERKNQKRTNNVWKTCNQKDTFKAIHSEISSIYTLKQNNYSKGNLEKVGFCKNEACLSRCKIILYGSSEENCELFYNQHPHLLTCNTKHDPFKNADLIELCKTRLKPTEIIESFNEKYKDSNIHLDDIEETRKKISRIKHANKKQDEDTKICNIKELEQWFDKKCVSNLSYEDLQSLNWDDAIVADYEIRGNQFAAFITSKNLELNLIKQLSVERICLAADGTYKLNENGHPTIVIGLCDVQRKFHLSKFLSFFVVVILNLGGFGIVTEESKWSYEKIFSFHKKFMEKCFLDISFNPRFLMADGALYIRAAAKMIWPNIIPTLCSFHFTKAYKSKLVSQKYIPKVTITNGRVNNKLIPNKILECFNSHPIRSNDERYNPSRVIRTDIKVLQSLPTQALFNQYLKFIKPFWNYFGKNFYNYFTENYINETSLECRSGWQNYIKFNSVSSNNALEAFNKIIKDVQTHYTRLKLQDYLDSICNEITRRSIESSKTINFPKTPFIPMQIMTFGKLLAEKFHEYFLVQDSVFYIKDKYLSYTLYNPKRGMLKKHVKDLARKLESKHEESIASFYAYYSKPETHDISLYNEPDSFYVRIQFLRIACIRKVKLAQLETEEENLRESSCTCPDWFSKRICPHLIACLLQENKITVDLYWKTLKKKGRKPKVPGALIH